MMLNIPVIVVIYFLIGLFIAGLYVTFVNNPDVFMFILFFWPIIFIFMAIIIAVVMPVVLGKWVGNRIKEWF